MNKFFYFLAVGLVFTFLQVATVSADTAAGLVTERTLPLTVVVYLVRLEMILVPVKTALQCRLQLKSLLVGIDKRLRLELVRLVDLQH